MTDQIKEKMTHEEIIKEVETALELANISDNKFSEVADSQPASEKTTSTYGLDKAIENKHKQYDTTHINPAPIFLVNNMTDAVAIIQAGAEAISIDSGLTEVISTFKQHKIKRPLLIVNSNNPEQQQENDKLFNQCRRAGLETYKVDLIPDGLTEISEFYYTDPDGLKQAIKEAESVTIAHFEASLNKSKLSNFLNGLSQSANTPAISTGFKTLDSPKFLDGGLYEGLYIIGAISSLGKTSLMLQIADQVATAGNDVLYISLEMSTNELIAKSISRYTVKDLHGTPRQLQTLPKTVREITDMRRYENYSPDELDHINKAISSYFNDTGETMRIVEGIGNISVETIQNLIKEHIKYKGKAPIVFIDYLQLLAPPIGQRAMTDKQIIDTNVMKLKQLSRDYKTPIFAISSFNRTNYNNSVSMLSFKESGAIEYSSDVLIGLERVDGQEKDPIKIEQREKLEIETGIRHIRLKILKNRNGQAGGNLLMDFHFRNNYFTDAGDEREISNRINNDVFDI